MENSHRPAVRSRPQEHIKRSRGSIPTDLGQWSREIRDLKIENQSLQGINKVLHGEVWDIHSRFERLEKGVKDLEAENRVLREETHAWSKWHEKQVGSLVAWTNYHRDQLYYLQHMQAQQAQNGQLLYEKMYWQDQQVQRGEGMFPARRL
ncbi:hypothetical protein H2203_005181 [Taxawa tesnikishii (nom. ined.)]|nr:hypothetical protein H2203_005181 [Dothideales sp. JES 119]